MKKKILIVLLAIVSTFVLTFGLFACSGRNNGSTQNPPPTEESEKYTVAFETNGGSAVSSCVLTAGEIISVMPYTSKSNFSFLGWYDNSGLDGTAVSFPYNPTRSLTLYAKWEKDGIPQTYAVYFELNYDGATDNPPTISGLQSGAKISAPFEPTRKSYVFEGWFRGAATTNAWNFTTDTVTENITLYAKWSPKQFKIEYKNLADGINPNADVTSYTVESDTITFKNPTGRSGFNGSWDISHIEKGSTGDKVITAIWTPFNYTVRFDANGGSGSMDEQNFTYGTAHELSDNKFVKSGYDFIGWNTNADGSGVSYANSQEVINLSVEQNAEIVLYAQWSGVNSKITLHGLSTNPSYTVSFDCGAGSPSFQEQVVTTANGLEYPGNPKRYGYVFGGWRKQNSYASVPYDFTEEITENKILEARWVNPGKIDGYAVKEIGMGEFSGTVVFPYYKNAPYYFAFIPLVDESVTLRVSGANGSVYLKLLNSQLKEIKSVLDEKINYRVAAGELYYVSVAGADNGVSGKLYVDGTATPDDGGLAKDIFAEKTVAYDSDFTLNIPFKDGHCFLGWYDGANGTGTQYTDSTGVSVKKWDRTVQTTLYAKWSVNSYSLSFDANGGDGNIADVSVEFGAAMPEIAVKPTKYGYIFKGYFDEKTSGKQYYASDLSGITPFDKTADVTLYAQWTPVTFTVRFNANGGSGTMPEQEFTYDVVQKLNANVFGKAYKDFAGWSLNEQSVEIDYVDEQAVSNLIAVQGCIVDLFAQWTASAYKVVYNANGGFGEMTDSEYVYGTEKALNKNTFTRTDYAFSGWAVSADGEVVYTDEQSVVNLIERGLFNLYAVWEISDFTIIYDANGGAGKMEATKHSVGADTALRANAFTRGDKYVFEGWSRSNESGSQVQFADSASTADFIPDDTTVTLYAKWKYVGEYYTVKFINQYGTYSTLNNIEENSLIEPPWEPTRDGYEFGGWFKDTSFKNVWLFKSDKVNENIELYARWIPMYADYAGEYFAGAEYGTITLYEDGTYKYSGNNDVGHGIYFPAIPFSSTFTIDKDTGTLILNGFEFGGITPTAKIYRTYIEIRHPGNYNLSAFTVKFSRQ